MEGPLRRAFSLIETVFSISLIALVLMLVFNLFPTSSVAVHRARQEQQAMALAQAVLEELRSRPFSQLEPGRTTLDNVTVDGVTYRRVQEISPIDGQNPERLRDLRVSVSWQDRKKEHQLTQEAYVARLSR